MEGSSKVHDVMVMSCDIIALFNSIQYMYDYCPDSRDHSLALVIETNTKKTFPCSGDKISGMETPQDDCSPSEHKLITT